MHKGYASVCRVLLLSAAMLFGAGATWLNSAIAAVFRVDLSGTFTSGGTIPPNTPFVGVFLVDTTAAPVQTETLPGLTITGYLDAAVTALSITAGGVTFTKADIQDRVAVAGHQPVAVYFSAPLTNGATPEIQMLLENQMGSLVIGGLGCGDSCSFSNNLEFTNFQSGFDESTGTVSIHVTLLFAGTPGAANCNGKSVSALAKEYGGLNGAATALGYSDVAALQSAIKSFCGN